MSVKGIGKFLNDKSLKVMFFLHDHNTDKFTFTEICKLKFYSSDSKLNDFLKSAVKRGLIKKTMINGQRRKYAYYEIKAEANKLIEEIIKYL